MKKDIANFGKLGLALSVLAALSLAEPARANDRRGASVWTELGTGAGPIAHPSRSQPAHLLRHGNQTILIDAGDGAAGQLAKANVELASVNTVILSHLHFDHIGGLYAILGMRYQTLAPGNLHIYGPRGTKKLVDHLVEAIKPIAAMRAAMPDRQVILPSETVVVTELSDGSSFQIDGTYITAATNSHYSFPPGSDAAEKFLSLSFRFDMPDRSIVYTGDTGPSDNVVKLATGADVLVSEMIDPEVAVASFLALRPETPASIVPIIEHHMRQEHLTSYEAGLMAHRAGVKTLVVTHAGLDDEDAISKARMAIARNFKGEVVFANDLESF